MNTSSEYHLIDIVVTNKNLAETEQWKIRAGDTFKTCDNINIDILSSKSVNKNMSDYIMKIIKAKTKEDLPNILIVCFHQKRIKDIIDLVETFGKTSFVLNDTKIKFHISLDEPDANLGPAKFLIGGLREYVDKKLIVGILFITATPIDTFWKMLSESGISTLLNINRDAVNNYEEDLEKYASNMIVLEFDAGRLNDFLKRNKVKNLQIETIDFTSGLWRGVFVPRFPTQSGQPVPAIIIRTD